MDFRIDWTESARNDLKNIVTYIAEDDPVAALNFGEGIIASVDQLERFPRSGRVVREKEDDQLREIPYSPYRIVYEIDDDNGIVNIVRVWHTSREKLEIE